jgi:D-alanine-D-alanine ligase
VESVKKALEASGHAAVRIPFTRDLHGFTQRLKEENVDIAFNLCESVDENAQLVWHPAAVLELLGIPFSGSPSTALLLTTDKLLTKRLLKASGIRTPGYLVYNGSRDFSPAVLRFPVIVKPRFEDASIGIDQDSIFENEMDLCAGLQEFFARHGTLLVEEFITGREFNISLLGYPVARVLPIAEIDFSAFPENFYPLVGYRAKWERDSFEYHHTPRSFPQDLSPLTASGIQGTALDCFRLFELRDYGRVDMRVDDHGKIYILEVNANPCLSPDAGFAASVQKAGVSYSHMISMIVDFAIKRAEGSRV